MCCWQSEDLCTAEDLASWIPAGGKRRPDYILVKNMRDLKDMLRDKKAVLFDMDGTLIDSIGVWNEADRLLARELTGTEPDVPALQALRDEALRRFRQEPDPYLCYCGLLRERYGTAMTREELYARRYVIAHELLKELDYKPGADKFLLALKRAGYILAVVSTTRRRSIDVYRTCNKNIMEKAPLDTIFDRIYTSEDATRIKPDSEIYFRVFREMELVPEACLVFEDSLAGVQAAKNAGLEVCAVYDPYSDQDRVEINALADWRAESFSALLPALGLEWTG